MLTSLLCLTFLAAAQPSETAPPLPPPTKKAEVPATPQTIRVGCHPQRAYIGPGWRWRNGGSNALSDSQIAEFQQALAQDPEDLCARAYLLAFGKQYVSNRLEHVLWMIEHHPEWDGFQVQPSWAMETESEKRAWAKQTGPDQHNGMALHNAAVFLQWTEPDFAEALLERAIRSGADAPFHIEGLGRLYGNATGGSRNKLFAVHARAKLLSTTDPLLIAGA